MGKRKLYLSNEDRQLEGVCGGLGEYFKIDSTLIRLLVVFIALKHAEVLLLYVVCAIVIPRKKEEPLVEELCEKCAEFNSSSKENDNSECENN